MNNILDDLSPENLILANEQNLAAFGPVFGRMGRYCEDNPPGVKRSISDIPISLFNSVLYARLAPGYVEEAVQVIQADARARKVPVLWWIGPSSRPLDLAERLQRYGFRLDEESPGMAIELEKMVERPSPPPGLTVQQAQDGPSFYLWSRAMSEGFEIPGPVAEMNAAAWGELLNRADPETVRVYTGFLDGKPVATSLLFLAAGVAGIYAVATIPEARGKGIGRYITQYPLCQARTMGYRAGILGASEMGFNVYRSLGFQENCRIASYRWRP